MHIIEQYMKLPALQLKDIRDYISMNLMCVCDDIIVALYQPSFNDGDACVTRIRYFLVKIGDELISVGNSGEYKEQNPHAFKSGQVVGVCNTVREFVRFLTKNAITHNILCNFLHTTDRTVHISIMTGEEVGTPEEDDY